MAISGLCFWHANAITQSGTAGRTRRWSNIGASLPRRAKSLVRGWTPFLLVLSYFVFSTCMYTFCTAALIKIFWLIFLVTNFYIAASTFLEAIMSLGPARVARKVVDKLHSNDWAFPTPNNTLLFLDLVIVAYLPNEADIIMDRVQYALDEIAYPSHKLRINLVYNTPSPIEPLEMALRDIALRRTQFRLFKVPGSKPKADNLNYFLSLDLDSDIVGIFDADHYPHPNGPGWAVQRFLEDEETSIVQGRCVIFNSMASWLSSMIAVEFDKIYAVSHPGRAVVWGFGIFTGSNGYWRTSLLRKIKMDGSILTEDIDSSMRAIEQNAKIVHDLNVISYELAPTTIAAMWKQRLRWAQGWTQVSMKYAGLTFKKAVPGRRSFKCRFGLISLLLIRELSYYLVTQYMCLLFSIILTQFRKSSVGLAKFVFFPFPVSDWFFIISNCCLVFTLLITNRAKSEFISRTMIIMFSVIFIPYLIFNAIVGLYGHARQVVLYSQWDTTRRQ